jgi:signal transduction histidine kinase
MARLGLAAVSLGAIYLDPTEPVRYERVAYGLLALYLAYSACILALVRLKRLTGRFALSCMHALDVLAAALLMLATDGTSSPFFVFFAFALLAAGYRWGLRETVTTGLVTGVLFLLQALVVRRSGLTGGLVEGDFELNRFIIRSSYLVLLAGMVGYIAEQEKRARAEAAARATAEERGRLGRELHDGLVQTLVGLSMQMDRLGDDQQRGDPTAFRQAHALLDRELIGLRAFMFETTPMSHESNDLSERLADVVGRFDHTRAVAARFLCTSADTLAPGVICHELERLVREALINVGKHSRATAVTVNLAAEPERWRLVIEDDGQGFGFDGQLSLDELDRSGQGPRVMKERIRSLGGTLVIASRPGRGASIDVSIPRRR